MLPILKVSFMFSIGLGSFLLLHLLVFLPWDTLPLHDHVLTSLCHHYFSSNIISSDNLKQIPLSHLLFSYLLKIFIHTTYYHLTCYIHAIYTYYNMYVQQYIHITKYAFSKLTHYCLLCEMGLSALNSFPPIRTAEGAVETLWRKEFCYLVPVCTLARFLQLWQLLHPQLPHCPTPIVWAPSPEPSTHSASRCPSAHLLQRGQVPQHPPPVALVPLVFLQCAAANITQLLYCWVFGFHWGD